MRSSSSLVQLIISVIRCLQIISFQPGMFTRHLHHRSRFLIYPLLLFVLPEIEPITTSDAFVPMLHPAFQCGSMFSFPFLPLYPSSSSLPHLFPSPALFPSTISPPDVLPLYVATVVTASKTQDFVVIMVALCNRADHNIFIL